VFISGHLKASGLRQSISRADYLPEPLIIPRKTVIEAFGKTNAVCGPLEMVVPTGA
jgi:hypothetical protein